MGNPNTRLPAMALLMIWFVIAAIKAAELKPVTKTEEFLSDDHPIQKAITILGEEFPAAAEEPAARIYFTWGLKTLDRTGVNQLFDPEFIGEPVFIDNWELNAECQAK